MLRFTRDIKGKRYGILKVPNHSKTITITQAEVPAYIRVEGYAGNLLQKGKARPMSKAI